MNLTGARRFIAVFGSGLLCVAAIYSQDCSQPGLNPQERLSRFHDLDTRAQAAMQQKRFSEAVEFYREATCLAPDSPRGLYGLGVAEAASGDFLNAREALRKADRIQPTSPLPLAMEVRINFSLNDMDALKANLREEAERFPRDAQLHALLARFLAEKKLVTLALAESLRAQQAGSSDPDSKVQLAILENAVGAYDDAIRNAVNVERRTELSETLRASAAGVAGLSYESVGQRENAIAHLQAAIRLDPSRENSYLALADVFEQTQKYADAVAVLKQGHDKLPASTAILLPLGSDLIRTEKYQEGIDVLRELLRQAPDHEQAYLSIADAARKMGNSSEELQALRDLSRRKPDYPMIHVLLARAMLNASPVDYPKVLEELAQAEKAAPADADVFYLRGKVYVATNRYKEAVAALQRSIELRPMDPSPYYQLARAYQKIGKPELAKEQFERLKVLEAPPSN
jgi:tetratricopeptide (TPR) repeat protein